MNESERRHRGVNYEDMKRQSQEHRIEPKIGDYWHEMFTPILVVVGVTDDAVSVCKPKSVDHNHWTWDMDKIERMTRDAFAKYVTYEGCGTTAESLKDKCWCDVVPEAHPWVIEHAVRAMFGD
jgi:hypothetical protein